MKKLVTLLALAGAITAQAQSRYITEGALDYLYRDGVATYSDNNGMVATSWFSMQSKTTQESGKWLMQVHCESRLIRTIKTITYNNNHIVYNTNENWNAPWRNPVPGSFEARMQEICYTR